MKTFKSLGKRILLVIFLILVSTTNMVGAQTLANPKTFLPIVQKAAYNGFKTNSKFIGIYMQQYWTDGTVATYMPIADNLSGKKHSVSAWFINIQNIAFTSRQIDNRTNNFYRQLEALWTKGYISFVNFGSGSQSTAYDVTDNCPIPFSAYQVANGQCDRAIQKMADLYYQWVNQPNANGRRAFLAPLPEMNGVNANGQPWTSYGGDPTNFKLAYQHIQDIFAKRGVTRDQVWWVFAPNGWSKAGHEFENYYPGDNIVDVIGFSMYNYGYCQVALAYPKWENYDTLYAPYISRIHTMAPNKPIIIAQTGSTDQTYYNQHDANAKNTWLQVNYEYLSTQPQVLGILYYDYDLSSWECYWKITDGNTYKPGYSAGAAYPAFQYLTWQNLQSIIP
jgi:hypothetical protein